MTAILRDLALQVLSLAAVFGGTLAALLVVHGVLVGGRTVRAWWRERGACERIGRDQVRGCVQRLTMRDLRVSAAERR